MNYEYFDWAATSPMSEEAIASYVQAARLYPGNPSANHESGHNAAIKLLECRDTVSKLLGCKSDDVYFTSGGTESDSIILNSALISVSPGQVIISKAEHSAIKQFDKALKDRQWEIQYLPCPKGYANSLSLEKMLNPKTRYVFIMLVNNILGSIEDIPSIVRTVRDYEKVTGRKIHIHTDAVQAIGKIPVNFDSLGVDSLAISGHKFCGPRGVGILINRNPAIKSVSVGGGQEKGIRPGTENLSGICALTTALKIASENLENNLVHVKKLHDKAVTLLRQGGFEILSPVDGNFTPYILNISTKTIPSEVFVRVLSDKGFCISAGSACNNNSKRKTEGLADLGFTPSQASTSIRISFGYSTTEDDLDSLCSEMIKTKKDMRI